MTNRYVHGSIKFTVTQLIEANRKSAALEMAHHQCHEKNMELSRLILLDEDGREHRVYVSKISGVKWYYAEPTEICNRFSVKGKIGLEVYMEADEETTGELRRRKLSLRAFNDIPAIVITVGAENVFLRVQDFDIQWDIGLFEANGYLAAV
ncbi:hypothetical protein [Paenibacillus hamazuiensis]|uniref:hypothetical protein n=1 Tax=Paenibacillus hamazuiensis TaxID=2936508 RepID=UPI00201027B4|nr:hypothetical protein [Paenibacillus hamazuiensis]